MRDERKKEKERERKRETIALPPLFPPPPPPDFTFFFATIGLAAVVPGIVVYGLPTASGKRLPYLCNGYLCYYICIGLVLAAQFSGLARVAFIVEHFGEFLACAVLIGDVSTICLYFYGIWNEANEPARTGNIVCEWGWDWRGGRGGGREGGGKGGREGGGEGGREGGREEGREGDR